ncbi:MAG TPA: DNA mismatch repair endonuclease MutL [Candidatus Baltobacteraceae bacterium]|nr:DNA mismatch repair endonuclease MutL [Candidatus Baltobacteraceae bacterium]
MIGEASLIRELDPQTIGQIAAGEVIERPVSVVKELVENAIDAGATRIDVTLEDGGVKLIEVVDNGTGIAAADLPLAVRRHATSKLATASDLESVDTLGFRGEGLASIAAVAQVEIVSRLHGAEIGARITAHAERGADVEPAAAAPGTRVRASALFANVPVRREYLRSPSAEFGRVSSWLSTFALAYPGIAFSLHHDGAEIWVLPASPDPQARLAAVFGKTAAQSLIALDPSAARGLSGGLHGFISSPGTDRADRRMQLLFVNGRLLRSSLLAGAWTAGYSTFAMIGRQPYGVLFLTLPPEHVDPNVHPTKSDVRLRYGHQVFDAVKRAISSTLHAHATARFGSAAGISAAPQSFGEAAFRAASLFEPVGAEEPSSEQRSGIRVLAQLDATFILATDGRALVLVDQHAAHERVAYERIVAAARNAAASEPLLVPVTFELAPAEAAALDAVLDMLREAGLEIEQFGERTYRIVATPAGYRARSFDISGFLNDLTEDPKQRNVHERVWASLACHSVTRAGERMEPAEMERLLHELQSCENPMHCPHGRPTIVRLDSESIQKLFKRI